MVANFPAIWKISIQIDSVFMSFPHNFWEIRFFTALEFEYESLALRIGVLSSTYRKNGLIQIKTSLLYDRMFLQTNIPPAIWARTT